ncbi:kinase-like domain-containing protein [Hypoxylon rubiginosum]|uniref:Kinase-like domain-containing protein n=1 Tax=Hypoxylon rubiginosum TaxID=110542 RepID=A0ACC0CQW0_9PEZI|nr:kinase-like domain-containing protein [Hypoxylon rubiginosum]
MVSKPETLPCKASLESDPPVPTGKLEKEQLTINGEPTSREKKVNIIQPKGNFLGGGSTGLVEHLESGDVIKSPWTGHPTNCRQEMAIEAQIYERLGEHPRIVQLKCWDPVDHTLTLEYMPHGNLKEYVKKHGENISVSQKQKWATEAAEGVGLLHSKGVVQGDVGPHNFLLDVDLSLKICDFAGSSLDGSWATVAPGVRYRLPSLARKCIQTATIKEDLFALGSTIYFIATGHEPYNELDDEDEVGKLYADGIFPDLGDVPFAEAIELCWKQRAESTQRVVEIVRRPLR